MASSGKRKRGRLAGSTNKPIETVPRMGAYPFEGVNITTKQKPKKSEKAGSNRGANI